MRFLPRILPFALVLAAGPAAAHTATGEAAGLAAGFQHPLAGLDHVAAMIAVGLWAAVKGGRALWVWPAAFVGVMLGGAVLGLLDQPLPFVEPAVLASAVVLGLLVALGIDLPFRAGAAIVGVFALFHGHAHGSELPAHVNGLAYAAGFAMATAFLIAAGVAAAMVPDRRWSGLTRAAGAACAVMGALVVAGVFG